MNFNEFNQENDNLESSLLQQFSRMSTSNRDDLVKEFQRLLLPSQLSPERCAFFLDMNNWNLQQAICSYFDFDDSKMLNEQSMPEMSFVKDVTIGEGQEVPPDTQFVKTWRISNSGREIWPAGCYLRFVAGEPMHPFGKVRVDPLNPGQIQDISVTMLSPEKPGIYQGQWRMCTFNGQFFGEIIWVIITVDNGGLLGLTQQLNSFTVYSEPVPVEQNSPGSLEHVILRTLVQRFKDSEMQIDEENQRN